MIQIGTPPATIDTPIEHLMACHRRIEQRLETLILAAGHLPLDRAAALAAIRNALSFMDTSGVLHTKDEEVSLFPRLRGKLSVTELAFVDLLETQHGEAEAIYSQLKRLASDMETLSETTDDSIAAYFDCATKLRDFYRDHIRAEDEILAPAARRVLSEFEITEISGEMRARRQKA